MKQCRKCLVEKSIDEFAKDSYAKDKHQGKCRACQSALASAWAKANPERCREIDKARYVRSRDKRKAAMQAIRDRDRPAHREKMKAWGREKYRRDPGKVRAVNAAWAAKNPTRVKALRDSSNLKRRSRLANAPGNHTAEQRDDLVASYLGRCVYCQSNANHFDHVVPLARGGTNDIENLAPACARCNVSKGAKSLLAFLVYRKAA